MSIEKAKIKLEIMKVICGAEEMKYKIMERKADIKRLEENIIIQENRIKELEAKLTELEG
jgi:SMC interacting uncharacterized protein involved in chromosome segregation